MKGRPGGMTPGRPGATGNTLGPTDPGPIPPPGPIPAPGGIPPGPIPAGPIPPGPVPS